MIDDDDTYAPEWLNPPPSVSTTPFPTFRDVPIPELSRRFTCQASLVPTINPTAAPSFTAFPTSGTAAVVSFKVKKQVRIVFDLLQYHLFAPRLPFVARWPLYYYDTLLLFDL